MYAFVYVTISTILFSSDIKCLLNYKDRAKIENASVDHVPNFCIFFLFFVFNVCLFKHTTIYR